MICSSIGKINTSIGTLNSSVNNVEKWFTLQNGRLVTTYPLISEKEICAYGLGESGDIDIDITDYVSNVSMEGYWIPTLDSRYLQADSNVDIGNHLLNVGGNTSTGYLFVRNAATLNGTLSVSGKTTLTNSSINNSLTVKNNVSLGGKLYTNEIRTPINSNVFLLNSATNINGDVNMYKNTSIGGNLTLDSSRVCVNIGKFSNADYDSSIRFYNGKSYIKVGADAGDMTIYSNDQITLDCPVDSAGVHIKGGYMNLDS